MSLRKLVLAILMVIIVAWCYIIMFNGLNLGAVKINSYYEVQASNKGLEQQISELNRKNTTEFESKKTALDATIKEYKATKEEYESLAPSVTTKLEAEEEIENSGVKPYDVEFLLVVIGNYATKEGITINYDLVKSGQGGVSKSSADQKEFYTMTDINFTISGDYNSVIEFLYHIEDDDRLNFEINNFKMAQGGKGDQATFTVKNIPVNNNNLTGLSSESSNSGDDSTSQAYDPNNPLNLNTNSVNKNLISNDVKSQVSSDSSNTTSNTTN